MPVRLVDRAGSLGSIQTALAGASSGVTGTADSPSSFSGSVATNLASSSAAFSGVFDAAPNRTGTISPTLSGFSSTILSSEPPLTAGDEDWATRSTAAGVVYAENDWTAATVDAGTRDWQGNKFAGADHVSRELVNKCSGGASLRMDILKTDTTGSGQFRAAFGQQFATGEPFYVQFRQYFPEYYATHAFKGTSGGFGEGWKQIIVSNNRSSNQLYEVVLQNSLHRGLVQGYSRNTNGSYVAWETPFGGSDFVFQDQIDRGYGTASALASRRTKGGLYSYGGNTGDPDPQTGAFIYYPDEWLTFLMKITPGTFGGSTSDSRVEVWAARNGADYIKLNDLNVDLGGDGGDGAYFDALWLLPYNTNRTADATRQDTYTLYDEVIVSTNAIAVPAITQPTWLPSSGAIVEQGNNTLNDVVNADLVGTSGHVGTAYEVMANYSGGDIVMKRGAPYLAIRGAGHGSSINGVYGWGPLTGENPKWQVIAEISPSPSAGQTYFSDGQPNANHTYNNLCGNDDHHLWLISFEGIYSSGADRSNIDRLDVDIGEWAGEGVYPNVSRNGARNGATAYKPGPSPGQGSIYDSAGGESSGTFGSLNEVTEAWTSITQSDSALFMNYVAALYDADRDRFFSFDDGNGYYQFTDGSTLSVASHGQLPAPPGDGVHSIEHDTNRDKYVQPGRGNQNIYELDPVSLTWSTRSFSGATPAAGHSENNGHYGRFRYYAPLGIYVYAPSEATGVYVYGAS